MLFLQSINLFAEDTENYLAIFQHCIGSDAVTYILQISSVFQDVSTQ